MVGFQSHDRIGVVLAQLGTPDAPNASALRVYLRQFLSDRRVIDYPAWLWQPILHGIILRLRPRRSAKLYARIWQPEGSPLLRLSKVQMVGLQARLGDAFRVVTGMTYGNPSIASAVSALEAEGITRIIVLPMFPQYSSTTTASVYDAVCAAALGPRNVGFHGHKRFVPALRFVEPYYDHPGYIDAMKRHLEAEVAQLPHPPDKFVLTFHGIPTRYDRTGDPYRQQCEQTARLLADAMGWRDDVWILSFQSRFGPEKWLEPATDEVLEGLYAQGTRRPLVFSPGFVTDCLETLDELGHEGQEQFFTGGRDGATYHLAPCLNDAPAWLDVMAALVHANAGGWAREPRRASPAVAAPGC